MKKTLLCMLILVLSFGTLRIYAQSTTTAADGTATNSYVPIYGFYADAYLRSQTIYPSPMLTGMVGNSITAMTFYLSAAPEQDWGCPFVFQLAITSNNNFSSSTSFIETGLTQVYSGLVTISNNQMTINFTTPFVYTGGNLLLDVQNTEPGTYASASFYGMSTPSNFSLRGYNFNGTSAISNPSGQMFIPKVTFTHSGATTACLPPRTPLISGINTHEATLSWTPLGDQNSWQVYCDTGTVDLDQVSWITVTDTFHTFTGLNANTEYSAYIRTNCGDHQSVHLIKKFWTSLEHVEIPFTCDFEDENVNFSMAIRNGNESNMWYVGSSANNTPNGEKALYITNNGLTNTYNIDAPSSVWTFFDVNFPTANEFLLSFDWRAYGEGNEYNNYDFLKVFVGPPANVEAGSFSTPTDATEIGLYNLQNSWQTANVILPNNFSNSVQRVYFLWRNDNSVGTNPPAAIDNISITASNCRRPDSLIFSNITTTSVTFDISPALGNNSDWEIVCTNSTSAPVVIHTQNPTGNLIENLNPSDYYTIYARTICGEGDTSLWSTPQTFHTECATSLNVPQFWGFEEDWEPSIAFGQENLAPLCWHVYNGGIFNSSYNWTWNHSSESAFAHSGSGSAMCYTDYATGAHNDWLITPQISLTGTQMLSFYAQRYDATVSEPEEISIWISDVNITLTAPANATDSLPGFTKLFQTDIPQGAYQLYEVPLTNYSGNRYIAFVRRETPNDGYYLRLDDVTIDEQPACSRPDNLHIENISAQEATIAWSATGSPVNVYYKPDNTTNFILANNNPLSDSTFTLTGLNPNSSYTVYVASLCTDGTENATQPVSFTTNCLTVVVTETDPFTENFNTLTSGIPACWDNSEGSTITESYKWNYHVYGHTGACVRFDSYVNSNGRTNMLKTPTLNLSALVNPTLSFTYKNPNGGNFSIYLSTDGGLTYPTAIATNLANASEWTDVDYSLTNMDNNENVIIVFIGTSNYGNGDAFIYLDDVFVGEGSPCAHPTNLSVIDITNNSIGLAWQEVGTASSWNVAYGPTGFTFSDSTIIESATDTALTISNLTTGQEYDFYVQSVCGEGVSSWNGPVTAAPGRFNFGRTGSSSITSCGITIYDNGGPNGNYSSSCSYSLTIYPSEADSLVSVSGTFAGESYFDYLSIHDGTAVTDESLLLKVYSSMYGGNNGEQINFGPLTSELGPLTLYFYSDASVDYAGFEVTVSCVAAPNCIRPHELSVNNVTSNEANVSWVNLSDNAGNELYYKQHDDSVYTVIPSSMLTNLTSYQLTELTPATSYDVFVTSICDEYTLASDTITFTTLCETFHNYPFVETFEDASTTFDCWTIIDANNDGHAFTRSSGYIYYPWHSTHSADDWLLSPTFMLNGRQTVEIEYWSTTFEEKFQVFAIRDDGTDTALTQIISVQTDVHQNLSIDLYGLTGAYQIGFHCVSDADKFNLYFDNFTIYNSNTAELTVEPASMNFNTIAGIASSAQPATLSGISLNNNITMTATDPFEISTDGTNFSATATIAVGTTDIEDTLYVRYNPSTAGTHNGNVIISSGELSDTITLTGTALDCSARTLPYTENFDNYTGGISSDTETPANYPDVDMPQCWLFPNRSESANDYPIVFLSSNSNYAVSGNCLFFKSSSTTPAYAVLPDFVSDIQNLQLYFTYRNQGTSSYNGTLSVGYMTDATDASTFVEIASFTRTTSLSEEFVRFNLVPSSVTNANIAFRYTGGLSDNIFMSIDNVQVEEVVPCDAPTELTVDDITTTSATVSWTASGDENTWNIQYKLQSASQWQEATVQTTSYDIEGLTASSTYDVRVKAICSADNQSDFVSTTFTTQTVGIDNITLANSISLMPNPANDYIELSVNSTVNVKEAMLYNAFGQMIQKVQLTDNHARINLSDLAPGMYFVRVNNDNESATKKFIKR